MDGKVNTKDIIAIKRHMVGIEVLSDEALAYADIFEDSKINTKDIIYIKRVMVGIKN